MSNKETFELDGRSYYWSGDAWLNAQTYIKPPGVVQQELSRRYGHRVNKPETSRKKQRLTAESKGIQKTIGPIIVDFIYQRYAETHDYVSRDEIRDYLLSHPEASAFLREAYEQTEEKRTFEWYVGNQVDWLSANYENPDRSEFEHLLEKVDLADGKKGYRPQWHSFAEGTVYFRDEVVDAIERWLPGTGREKREGKEANLAIIAQGPEKIRFMPQGEGWGRSAGNAACWVDAATGERLK
ncbi:MAG: hypothetical protein H6662_15510 [Ardenticatenaceae bacterium]|nr:hypothetical protein [Ardenticatenaceae bacterium]MCB8990273.1 hypothetical protein [Ardenticatenaceae bacterium]